MVVSDTSVLLNLCAVGREDLLNALYGEVLAPDAVAIEFDSLVNRDSRFRGLVFPPFVIRVKPKTIPPGLLASANLQTGEISAIALALERRSSLVLMDELAGRAAAVALGLRVTGLLGVLLEAKISGHLSTLVPILDSLDREAGFWMAPSLRDRVLKAAGEGD